MILLLEKPFCELIAVPKTQYSHPLFLFCKKTNDKVLYLRGFCENELRVLHQALQRHRDINDPCPFVFTAVVCHKLAIPGIEDDQTWNTRTLSHQSSLSRKFKSQFGHDQCYWELCGHTHSGLLCFDNSTHRLLHQQNLQKRFQVRLLVYAHSEGTHLSP